MNPIIERIQFIKVARTQATGPSVQIKGMENVRNPSEKKVEVVSPRERPVPVGIQIPRSSIVPAGQLDPVPLPNPVDGNNPPPVVPPPAEVLPPPPVGILPVPAVPVAIPIQQIRPVAQVDAPPTIVPEPEQEAILAQLPKEGGSPGLRRSEQAPPEGVPVDEVSPGAPAALQHSMPGEHTPPDITDPAAQLPVVTQVPRSPKRL